MRTVDNLRKICGITDPEELEVSEFLSPEFGDLRVIYDECLTNFIARSYTI